MAQREVKGLHRVVVKGREYWYAGRERGAPRIRGEYGTPDFWASFDEAIRDRHIPEPGKFRALVTLFKGSTDYDKLAASTKAHWSLWLDRIGEHFGTLSIAAFDNPKVRQIIRQWRNTYASTPRAADMGVQVLSRVCAHAVDPLGKLATNPCEGIKALYTSDRSDIIWTDADITRIKPHCTPEITDAIDLAAVTGLRRGALLRLAWSHVHESENCIEMPVLSGHKRTGIIPLYDELREVLARIPKRSPLVLTNSNGRPWTNGAFGNMFGRAKRAAGIGSERHFHDFRGTAATRFYVAGLSERVIAEIMGWSEDNVAKIIRKYVDRSAATKAVIRQLNTKRGAE
jgi:integrase